MRKLNGGVGDGLDKGDEQGAINCLSSCRIVMLGRAW